MVLAGDRSPSTEPSTAPTSDPAATQPPLLPGGKRPLRMVRTQDPPKIDGRLDDACWANAAVITDFTQVQPTEGGVPTERTEARLLYDDDAIYVAVRCYDSHPERILARQMQRDGSTGSDDVVTIVFDPFFDRRNGYFFEITAAGGRQDGLIDQGDDVRREWDGIWFLKTRIDELGWVVEMSLPAKTISFDPHGPGWGFNVGRSIRHKQEVVRWASPRSNIGARNIGEAGMIEGIEGLKQGIGLTLRPYVVLDADLNEGELEVEPSFDAFYRITPSITAALTVNTDFAEAEVDERQVNLTRFPLFFPEKRDFFLQDAGIFSFGGIGTSPLPFHSRRIGTVGGEPKDILTGVKITGRQGITNFGLLNVQMAEDDELGWRNFTVARAAFNIFEQSSVGGIVTHGDPDAPGNDSTLAGVDFNFRTSEFGAEHRMLTGNAYLMGTESADDEFDQDVAFGASLSYPNEDPWTWGLNVEQTGEEFDPGLGFVSRRGVREYSADLSYEWLPYRRFIYEVDLSSNVGVISDLDDRLESIDYDLIDISISNRIGDNISLGYSIDREVLDEPFDIRPDIIIPVDDYTTDGVSLDASTSGLRELSVSAGWSHYGFYTGYRDDYSTSITWRPGPSFYAFASYSLNDIHLDEGSFNVHIARIRGNVYFNPDLSWQNLVQWDSLSQLLGINSRVRWELEPGRDVFVVLNHGSDISDEQHWVTVGSALTAKVGLTFRY